MEMNRNKFTNPGGLQSMKYKLWWFALQVRKKNQPINLGIKLKINEWWFEFCGTKFEYNPDFLLVLYARKWKRIATIMVWMNQYEYNQWNIISHPCNSCHVLLIPNIAIQIIWVFLHLKEMETYCCDIGCLESEWSNLKITIEFNARTLLIHAQ